MRIVKDDGSIIYVGYIYRHWIISDKMIIKSYIGKTENKPMSRWHQDGSGYKDEKEGKVPTIFWKAICKYGWDNFNHDILLKIECTNEEELRFWLQEWERYYIWNFDSYCKNGKGYNMTLGGDGVSKGTKPWNYGKHGVYMEETLCKMSENRKGKCIGEENPFYGKKHTDESRKRMSDSQKRLYDEGYVNPSKGLKRSEEARLKMSIAQKERLKDPTNNPMYGKHHSEETRQKLSESRKGKYTGEDNPFYGKQHCEESKQKMREANIGKHPTEETRAKLSTSRIGANNPKARKVICIETMEIFDTLKQASDTYRCNVGRYLGGKSKYAGKHPETKEPLHWMYYDEYLKLEEKDDNENGKH